MLSYSNRGYYDSKGTVSFRLNTTRAAREIARDIVSPDQATYIDVELQGDYTDSQTQELEADKDIYITFENVPVGREINVYAQIYTLIEGEKQIIYAGTSETKTIQREENLFQFMLDFAYASYVETSSAYIVLRPLFSSPKAVKTPASQAVPFDQNSPLR